MQTVPQAFDFSKQMINATSKHITLLPGDKVIWRKTNRRLYGVNFDIRCTVVKPGAQTVKVLCRWRGQQTGEIISEARNVPLRCLYRHDWAEPVVKAKPAATAEEIAMDTDLAGLRSGKVQPIVRLTDAQLYEIERERIGG